MKRSVCWLLIFAIVLIFILPAGAARTADFADAADIRNDCAVQMLVDLELIVGDQSGNFRPNAPITRAETAKLIACLCTDTPEASGWNAFADTAGSWAKDYIAYCAAQGIVGGSGGYFRPQDDVTAQELAKMLLVVVGFDAQQYINMLYDSEDNKMLDIIADVISHMSERCCEILSKFYYEEKDLDTILFEIPTIGSKNALKTKKHKCMELLRNSAKNIYCNYLNS